MAKYLDKFVQSLPAVQGRQIIETLNKLKGKGAIASIEEYSDKLRELTTVLSSGKPTPISKPFFSFVGDSIDSESFNFMLETFEQDIETLYGEINSISDVAEAHRALINSKLIKNLEISVNALEREIKKYEALNRSDLGFSVAQYNNFSSQDDLRFSRSEDPSIVADMFFERSSNSVLQSAADASVDVLARALNLPSASVSAYTITKVDIEYTTLSDSSFFNVDFPELSINSIVDGENNTYWATTIMSENVLYSGASINLILTLDGLREISFIEIDPILYNNFYVKSINYVDKNGEQQNIFDESNKVLVDSRKKIVFSNISATQIIVSLMQKTHITVGYHTANADTLYDQKVRTGTVDINAISRALYNTDPTQPILGLMGIDTPNAESPVTGKAYTIGLDNIRIGKSEYKGLGVFASKPLDVEFPILLSLDVSEEFNYIGGNTSFPKSTIEYSIYKKNFDASNNLIDTEYFPVLPSGVNTIYREFLAVNSDTMKANTRFLPVASTYSVFAGENTTPLTEGVDYTLTGSVVTFIHDPQGTGAIFDPLETYTITYDPTKEVYMNNKATVFMDANNIIEFTLDRAVFPVNSSKVYLNVILRRNVTDRNETPSLKEYKILVAAKDTERYSNGI